MKKSFIIASSAVIVSALGCTTNSNVDEGLYGNGELAALRMSISMPMIRETRADYDKINATEGESAVSTISVYVFDSAGNAAATGAYTALSVTDFVEPTSGTLWEMDNQSTKCPIVTVAGAMRIWVGVNAPAAVRKSFDTEAALLAEYSAISGMVGNGSTTFFTMFSNAKETTLVQAGANDYVNSVAIEVDRVVSKIIASVDGPVAGVSWPVTWESGGTPTVTYKPAHWRVMQWAQSSYVAPHYNVKLWNTDASQTGFAETYKGALADYDTSVATGTQLSFATIGATQPVAGNDYVAGGTGRYIGENASREEVGMQIAKKGNTTYAFISTTVTVDKQAVWNTGDEVIEWETKNYGFGVTGSEDIYLVRIDGVDYLTSERENGENIRLGLAKIDAAKEGLIIVATAGSLPNELTLTQFLAAYPKYDYIDIFEYKNGYVHFMSWINKIDSNHYDVLRNQFIHIAVNGMNSDLEDGELFPGYPGDPDDPTIPIDPTDDDPNNPDPINPTDPVDPLPANLKISVTINPWTYRINSVLLGR